jgi:hypothetical protein
MDGAECRRMCSGFHTGVEHVDVGESATAMRVTTDMSLAVDFAGGYSCGRMLVV